MAALACVADLWGVSPGGFCGSYSNCRAGLFYRPLTKGAEYDRLVWAAAIVLSLWFYFLGAIVYFVVVKKGKPEDRDQLHVEKQEPRDRSQQGEG